MSVKSTSRAARLKNYLRMLMQLPSLILLKKSIFIILLSDFYRAMHFSAKCGIAIAYRLSVRLSVRPSVCPSVTLVDCDHIGWNSSKIILPLVSLGRLLFATLT